MRLVEVVPGVRQVPARPRIPHAYVLESSAWHIGPLQLDERMTKMKTPAPVTFPGAGLCVGAMHWYVSDLQSSLSLVPGWGPRVGNTRVLVVASLDREIVPPAIVDGANAYVVSSSTVSVAARNVGQQQLLAGMIRDDSKGADLTRVLQRLGGSTQAALAAPVTMVAKITSAASVGVAVAFAAPLMCPSISLYEFGPS